MDHADHVALLRAGVPEPPVRRLDTNAPSPMTPAARWADLGAGTGAFTLALAELLGPGATIHAVDRDGGALADNARQIASRYAATSLVTYRVDFAVDLPFDEGSLDGVVMANSLHFVRDKAPVLRRIIAVLRPGGRLLLVEYGSDRGNAWVPWPLDYPTWERLALDVGLVRTRRLASVPSRFLGSIYSAASERYSAASERP